MALGETLRKARMARKETASQVAAATRMKIQLVEGLEKEDFTHIPAPIYGKGFIKLYAEHVGLDPDPLIRDYMALLSATSSSGAARKPGRSRPKNELAHKPDRRSDASGDLFKHAGIAVGGETAPDEPKRETPAEARTAQTEIRRKPDANVLRSDLERYTVSRSHPADEPESPEPVGKAAQLLEAALIAMQNALNRLPDVAASIKNAFANVSPMRQSRTPAQLAVLLVGALLVAVLLLSGLSRAFRGDTPTAPPEESRTLFFAVDAPEPYFD